MAGICNYTNRDHKKWNKVQNEIWDYWLFDRNGNKRTELVERFTDRYEGFNPDMAAKNLRWFIEQRLELPYNKDAWNVFSKKDIRRIKVEIDSYSKALGGKFSNLAWVVPEGISKQDPTSRKFYNRLNEMLNYERIQVNTLANRMGTITESLTEAFIYQNKITGFNKRFTNNKAIEELREMRKSLVENPDDPNTMSAFVSRMESFINGDKNGATIKQYLELVQMNQANFKKAMKKDFLDPTEFDIQGNPNPNFNQPIQYNPYVYKAVEQSRQILNEMGTVYVKGLSGLKSIIALKFAGTTDLTQASNISNEARRAITKIKDLEKNLEVSMKGGDKEGYFPHMQFETVLSIKNQMDKVLTAKKIDLEANVMTLTNDILSQIGPNRYPDSVKRRAENANTVWEKDPLLVISEYGNQAIQFNKTVFAQKNYLESLQSLPKSDLQFQKGMKRFIDEEFAVFTRGTSARPDWANNAVMSFNALQTARTMGLNITGAVKNATSALHFYSRVGLSSLNKAIKAFNHDTDGITSIMRTAEKEAGFLFTDAAQELYTEGLISRNEFKSGDITYDPYTGKFMKQGSAVKDNIIKAGNWTLDKALFFHRITENNQRKWMFRVAFNEKYQYLLNNGYNKAKAQEFAKNHALQTVNSWAYEYAAHAKSKYVRGEGRTIEEMNDGSTVNAKLKPVAGMATELSMHLMHYPMSLAESTYSTLSGAHKSLLAKQGFDSPEIMHLMRYAGIASVISLASVMTNTDLFNLFEHDTVERIQRTFSDFNDVDNPDKGTFGLMSEFTGTNLGTLKHLMIVGGIIDIEHNDLNKILFGNVDFADENDRHTQMYSAYQYSTIWGQWKNKLLPAIVDGRGRDLITHTLKLYPTDTTKFLHETVFGKRSKKKAKKPKVNKDVMASLDLLRATN